MTKEVEKAIGHIVEAVEILKREIAIESAYDQMDFKSLPTGHYRWAVKLLGWAVDAIRKEQPEDLWKLINREQWGS